MSSDNLILSHDFKIPKFVLISYSVSLAQISPLAFYFSFIFGCTGSSFLCMGFLKLQRAGTPC